jgi:hypothetical protein
MKIVLQRGTGNSVFGMEHNQDATDYMRVVFAHISHKIWLKNVTTHPNGQIIVDYERQGGANNEDFGALIADAVSLRGDLSLISLEVPKEVCKVPGLRLIQQNEDGTRYLALPLFLQKLASDEQYRREIAAKKVVEVSYECVKGDAPGTLVFTGIVATTTAPGPLVDRNAYNKLAAAICNSVAIRENILNDEIENLVLEVKNDGSFTIAITQKELANEASSRMGLGN